nr:MAG TPA: hypothetical protein [Caudoviricetes sp.]
MKQIDFQLIFVLNFIKSNNLKVLLPFYHFLVTETRRLPCCKPPYLLDYISKPMVTLSALTVSEVLLIGISLPLKRYCSIGFMAVSEDDKLDKPFDEIQQVEEHIEHFFHLLGMYHFVIKSLITNLLVSSCEENPEEVHITETSRGNNFILDNLHTR